MHIIGKFLTGAIDIEQKLIAVHEAVPSPFYDWQSHCGKPIRTQADWITETIFDCVGVATIMNYSVTVTHQAADKGPSSATFSIDFRKPNKCKISTDPTTSSGGAPIGHYQLVYRFKGRTCNGEWEASTPSINLGLIVRLVNGQKMVVVESTYSGGGLN